MESKQERFDKLVESYALRTKKNPLSEVRGKIRRAYTARLEEIVEEIRGHRDAARRLVVESQELTRSWRKSLHEPEEKKEKNVRTPATKPATGGSL